MSKLDNGVVVHQKTVDFEGGFVDTWSEIVKKEKVQLKLCNNSSVPVAVKVKCTSNRMFKLSPVRFILPGQTSMTLTITYIPKNVKLGRKRHRLKLSFLNVSKDVTDAALAWKNHKGKPDLVTEVPIRLMDPFLHGFYGHDRETTEYDLTPSEKKRNEHSESSVPESYNISGPALQCSLKENQVSSHPLKEKLKLVWQKPLNMLKYGNMNCYDIAGRTIPVIQGRCGFIGVWIHPLDPNKKPCHFLLDYNMKLGTFINGTVRPVDNYIADEVTNEVVQMEKDILVDPHNPKSCRYPKKCYFRFILTDTNHYTILVCRQCENVRVFGNIGITYASLMNSFPNAELNMNKIPFIIAADGTTELDYSYFNDLRFETTTNELNRDVMGRAVHIKFSMFSAAHYNVYMEMVTCQSKLNETCKDNFVMEVDPDTNNKTLTVITSAESEGISLFKMIETQLILIDEYSDEYIRNHVATYFRRCKTTALENIEAGKSHKMCVLLWDVQTFQLIKSYYYVIPIVRSQIKSHDGNLSLSTFRTDAVTTIEAIFHTCMETSTTICDSSAEPSVENLSFPKYPCYDASTGTSPLRARAMCILSVAINGSAYSYKPWDEKLYGKNVEACKGLQKGKKQQCLLHNDECQCCCVANSDYSCSEPDRLKEDIHVCVNSYKQLNVTQLDSTKDEFPKQITYTEYYYMQFNDMYSLNLPFEPVIAYAVQDLLTKRITEIGYGVPNSQTLPFNTSLSSFEFQMSQTTRIFEEFLGTDKIFSGCVQWNIQMLKSTQRQMIFCTINRLNDYLSSTNVFHLKEMNDYDRKKKDKPLGRWMTYREKFYTYNILSKYLDLVKKIKE